MPPLWAGTQFPDLGNRPLGHAHSGTGGQESGKHQAPYHAWSPDKDLLTSWSDRSGKPILITEWYAKGADSGMGNTSGAGWLVKTQADRAAFYQNFTLGLLESRGCVGWHWFRYSDNDPAQKGTDPSNTDANKGIVSNRYAPYQPLLDGMREINTRTLGIIDHFDRTVTAK